jgi:hypothetical protein
MTSRRFIDHLIGAGEKHVRRRTVERVIATLKHWMGATHFRTNPGGRGANVSAEIGLSVLAYNMNHRNRGRGPDTRGDESLSTEQRRTAVRRPVKPIQLVS